MKKISLIWSLSFLTITSTFGQNIYDSIFVGNRWRTYMLHLPIGYNPSNQYSLLFCFHGGQSGASSSQLGWQAVAYMSNLTAKADSAGFIVVYPEGTVINNNRSWNAGACCPPATNNNVDDVGFIDHLIDTLKNDYAVDSMRIYASGSSNGAMLCFRLACELSNKIAAFATVSATHAFWPCSPANKVPVINFHSLVDSAVLYNGGLGNGPSGVSFISQDSTLAFWKDINNCVTTDTIVNGGTTDYSLIKVHDCACQVEFDHYVTSDGGHSWPGGNPNNNPVSYQINATYLLWNFLQNYTLGCLTLGDENATTSTNSMRVFPDPFTSHIYLANSTGKEIFTLFNHMGQIIWTGKNIDRQDFSFLASGLYVLRIDNISIKLLKQ